MLKNWEKGVLRRKDVRKSNDVEKIQQANENRPIFLLYTVHFQRGANKPYPLSLAYQTIGDGRTCERKDAIYTKTGEMNCDGWKGISLDECKLKCTQNAIPSDGCPRQNVQCAYVLYNPGWGCHLADKTCRPQKGDAKFTLIKKQG